MLSLIMKREITDEKRKEIEDCLIKFERRTVEFDDGIKFEAEKKIQPLENGGNTIVVNITEYVNNHCVSSSVYDHMYYMNVIVSLIRNAFQMEVACNCGDPNCNCEPPKKDLGDVYIGRKNK